MHTPDLLPVVHIRALWLCALDLLNLHCLLLRQAVCVCVCVRDARVGKKSSIQEIVPGLSSSETVAKDNGNDNGIIWICLFLLCMCCFVVSSLYLKVGGQCRCGMQSVWLWSVARGSGPETILFQLFGPWGGVGWPLLLAEKCILFPLGGF